MKTLLRTPLLDTHLQKEQKNRVAHHQQHTDPESPDDILNSTETSQIRRAIEHPKSVHLTPNLIQTLHARYGNRYVARIIQRNKDGVDPQPPSAQTNYYEGDVLKDGEVFYRIVKADERDEDNRFWTYELEDLTGYVVELSFNNLKDLQYLGIQTNEYWVQLKKSKEGNGNEPLPMRSGNVFYDWEKGTATKAKEGEIDKSYWEDKKSGAEDKHSRQFVSAQETKSTELEGGATAEVSQGVDYLKQTGTGVAPDSFIKRVGGFSFNYKNPEGRNKNLRWLQFLTTTTTKGEHEGGQIEVPLDEGEAKHRVDHNSSVYPYYDPGRQSDQEIMMFDDPEPNRGTFTRHIQNGANYVTEVDHFDTFLVEPSKEGEEGNDKVLFHAVIEVTFTCNASGDPEEGGYPIIKTSKIIQQNQATEFPKELSETLRAWYANKKK